MILDDDRVAVGPGEAAADSRAAAVGRSRFPSSKFNFELATRQLLTPFSPFPIVAATLGQEPDLLSFQQFAR
jgi:hypothetical protein